MIQQTIILQGGEEVKNRTNEALIGKLGELSATKKILVIPWTTDSVEREREYRTLLHRYFSDNGFLEVLFLEKEDTNAVINEKFTSADVVYLPGGDPMVLYQEMKNKDLEDKLRNFNGFIVGNSAGAIVLSRGAEFEGKFYPGFGIVDFHISVHYELELNSFSRSNEGITVNIPEDAWITITGVQIED